MKTKAIQIERSRSGQRSVENRAVLQAAAVGILSFLFGSARIFGAVSPFNVAFVCALPAKHVITAAIGGALGAFLFGPSGRTVPTIVAIGLVLLLRLLADKFLRRRVKPVLLCLTSFTITAFCAIFYGLLAHVSGVEFALLCIEVLLTASFTYFFAVGSNAALSERTGVYSYAELASLCILFIAAVTSLANLHILNVNIGVIVGVVGIYAVMTRYGLIGASVASIVVSIALNLYSMDMLEFSGILITASFIAGAFAPLKKFGQLSAFIASATFCLFLAGAPIALTYRLIDIFFATAVFILIPGRFLNLLKPQAEEAISSGVANSRFLSGSISSKLGFASETVRDLQHELEEVSNRFNEIDYNNIGTIYDAAAASVCKGCTRMLVCWDSDYGETVNAFNPVSDILRANGEVTRETLPSYFRDKCCKADKLCASVNEYYRAFVAKQNAKRQVSEARRIVFEQFHSIADMLTEVSEELGSVTGYDESMTRAVTSAWMKLEEEPEQILCAVDRYGRSCVEIYTDNALKTSPAVLSDALSAAALREFDLPTVSTVRGRTKVALFEKAGYILDFSIQQSCVGNNSVCGDSSEFFSDAKGFAYLLLSDGMGNGKRAAIDSVMTCSILSKLLKAGFGLESAIQMLNSSLLVKSTDESLATIDLAKVDLYTGKVELFKAGAATTFLCQNGEIRRFESGSLPVGILEGVGFESKSYVLRDRDAIVMVSDGATAAGEGWIAEEIRKSSGRTAKELAVKLCVEAKQKTQDHPDDITVMVAKLVRTS